MSTHHEPSQDHVICCVRGHASMSQQLRAKSDSQRGHQASSLLRTVTAVFEASTFLWSSRKRATLHFGKYLKRQCPFANRNSSLWLKNYKEITTCQDVVIYGLAPPPPHTRGPTSFVCVRFRFILKGFAAQVSALKQQTLST